MPQAGAAVGGKALAGAILGSSVLGFLGSREAGKRAQAAAAGVQQGPPPWLIPYLRDIIGRAGTARDTPLPAFPTFEPFTPDLSGLDYTPFPTPNIPGASGTSRGILRRIIELIDAGSPALEAGQQAVDELLSGESNQFYPYGEALLTSGPLVDAAAGRFREAGSPFTQNVIDLAREDYQAILEDEIARIESDLSGLGRGGETNTRGQLISEAREDILGREAREVAGLRLANYEAERGREQDAGSILSSLATALAGLRSGDIRTAGSIAPSLEAARFTGPGLAGSLSTNLDQLDQGAAMFEADFGARQHALDQQADALIAELEARYGFANNQTLNDFALREFGYNVEAPFLRENQYADLLFPIAGMFSNQTANRQYTPNRLFGALQGGLGGLLAMLPFLMQGGSQQGFDPGRLLPFGPFGFQPGGGG